MPDLKTSLDIVDALLEDACKDTERWKKHYESATKTYQKALDRQRRLEILKMELVMSVE